MEEKVLTKKYRPSTFDSVIGQKTPVNVLKAIAKNPEESPKSIMLYGPFGTGKTTLARVFSRALSCEKYKETGKICHKCPPCQAFINKELNGRYLEYDSAVVGNVEGIKQLRPVFDQVTNYFRVVVLDEIQVASPAAQSALLKNIEEGSPNTFFIFCTTNPEKVLNTIHSRSIPIELNRVEDEIMTNFIKQISLNEGFELPDLVADRIVLRADGHVRDAVTTLSTYLISKDIELINLPVEDIKLLFDKISRNDLDDAENLIKKILSNPISQVHRSLHYVIRQLVKGWVNREESPYLETAKKMDKSVMQVFKLVCSPWVQEAFKDEFLAYSFFLTLIKSFRRDA